MTTTLNRVNSAVIQETRKVWSAELHEANDSFSPSGYYNLLDSVQLHLNQPQEHFYHYALLDANHGNAAQAILEIVHVHPRLPDSYLKVLSIRMTPRLDTRNPNNATANIRTRHHEVAGIAGMCISKVLELTEEHLPAQSFKIYTSGKQTDIKLLLNVVETLSKSILKDAGIEADNHGNWLVISKTNAS